ncbi:MAG: hypothetical protein IPK24_06125 [Kineosporiaceae bacterium]|nr:hypothetical protein [Kineosporiaceae bacterium]MBK8075141.1 hypothetical protein [Kineosporiaceae bacterium]
MMAVLLTVARCQGTAGSRGVQGGRRGRRLSTLAATCVVGVAVGLLAVTATANAAQPPPPTQAVSIAGAREAVAAGSESCPGRSQIQQKVSAADLAPVAGQVLRPVVLVHGWDAAKDSMEPLAAFIDEITPKRGVQGYKTFLFNYGENSARWAARPEIAACLAAYLREVSAAYRAAGGKDGMVLGVGHSMGGLALRFAASGQYATNPADKVLGGIVTIDTPHTGAPWGGTLWAQLPQVLNHGFQGMLPFPPGSDGGYCLAPHQGDKGMQPGCAVPPWLPKNAWVGQVVGDIVIHRQLFGFELETRDTSSDGIVSIASSGGYSSSGPGKFPGAAKVETRQITCDLVTGKAKTGLGGLIASYGSAWWAALQDNAANLWTMLPGNKALDLAAGINFGSECGHTSMQNPDKNLLSAAAIVALLNHQRDAMPDARALLDKVAYQTYTNPRFSFSLQLPKSMQAGDPPANGDGLTFTDVAGATVTISGMNNVLGSTPSNERQLALNTTFAGALVTLDVIHSNALTLSGRRGGKIIYLHTVVGAGHLVTLTWTYPATQKVMWDQAVSRSVSTLSTKALDQPR